MARCPECSEKLALPQDLARWDHINCQSCNAELEVLSLKPLELEAVFDFEEDGILEDLDEDLEDAEDLEDVDDLDWDEDQEEEEEDEEEEDW